jgi:hypothetical protein
MAKMEEISQFALVVLLAAVLLVASRTFTDYRSARSVDLNAAAVALHT